MSLKYFAAPDMYKGTHARVSSSSAEMSIVEFSSFLFLLVEMQTLSLFFCVILESGAVLKNYLGMKAPVVPLKQCPSSYCSSNS